MPPLDRSTVFRIISLSLAAGDVFQTIPGTITLYRKQWRRRRLSALCFFYAVARYISILSLAANGYDAFSKNYTPETCRIWYMLPNVTALIAGMAVQVVVYIRTIAISGRSKYVRFGMGMVLLMGFPVQIFGIIYHREPYFNNGSCVIYSRRWLQILKHAIDVKEESFGQASYYSAHMVFDLIAFVTATYYLVYASWVQGIFHFPKFTSHILRDGLLYFLVVFLVNLWVVLEFAYVFTSGAASSLPLAVVLIAIQHLVLSTQNLTDLPSNTYRLSVTSASVSQGPPSFTTSRQQNTETETGDSFVHLEDPRKNIGSMSRSTESGT